MKINVLRIFIFVLFGTALGLFRPGQVEATSVTKTTGTVEVTTGWTNCTTTRLNTSDDSRTQNQSATWTTGFQISDFNFGIPSGVTIDGIEVDAELSNNNAGATSYLQSSLSWDNGTSWTANSTTVSVTGVTDTVKAMGGATDKWGRTWSTAELADGTFQVKIQGYTSNVTYICRIDYVTVTVYYTTKVNGQSCTLGNQCTSTYCVDSTCCDSACNTFTCQRCDASYTATAGTCGNINSVSDPDNECASYGCTSKVYGWSGNSCLAGVDLSTNGMCTGSSTACATSTTFANSCNTSSGGSTLASCGSAECRKTDDSSACKQDDPSTNANTVAKICYTSGQHGCGTGYLCDATGTCVIPNCTSVPNGGDYPITTSCGFTGSYNGVDAGTGTVNSAILTIGSVGTPGYLSVLCNQTIAAGSLVFTNGSITIIKNGDGSSCGATIKPGAAIWLTDADGDGYAANTTQIIGGGATGKVRRNSYSGIDTNDAQACADSDTNVSGVPGSALVGTTCQKCVTGALAIQTSAQDLWNQCTAGSYNACSTTCIKSGPGADCNGSSAACGTATANVAAGKVCTGAGTEANASSQATACDANTDNWCTAASCTGTTRWSECNANGTCDTTATTNYAIASTVNATAGQSLSTSCTSGANGNPGATCQKCNGSGSLTTQANNEDIYSQCAAGACGTDYCVGTSAACTFTDGGTEGTCAACKYCSGSSSTCINMPDQAQDNVGTNKCIATCKKCSSGSCVNQTAAEDLFSQCPHTQNYDFTLTNYGSGSSCTDLCKTYACNNYKCSGSGACSADANCSCTSVGTDAGGTNGYAMAEDCVQYSGKTCGLVCTNMGITCTHMTKWTVCHCLHQ